MTLPAQQTDSGQSAHFFRQLIDSSLDIISVL